MSEADVLVLVDRRLAELGLLPSTTPKPPRRWAALEPWQRSHVADLARFEGWGGVHAELQRLDATAGPGDLDVATLASLRTAEHFPPGSRHLPLDVWREFLDRVEPITHVTTEHERQAVAALVRHAETLAVVSTRLSEQEREGQQRDAARAILLALTTHKMFATPAHLSAAAATGIRRALSRGLLSHSKHLPADAWTEAVAPKGAA